MVTLTGIFNNYGSRGRFAPDSRGRPATLLRRRIRGSSHRQEGGMQVTVEEATPILERVGRNEPGAVDEMMSRFGGLVWSLARRSCPTTAEAEDAVQEIFIELWKTASRFDPSIAGEATFVAMITRRRLIDRTRRRTRRPEPVALNESSPAPESSDLHLEIAEEAGIASEAFERLRPEQRQVLSLAIHHGRSHEQIAATTGMPLGTVKTHARRGLIRLRQLLEANGFGSKNAAGAIGGAS
jgi:RNA polymerase sigma factor (sigma-70 family)